MVVRNYLVYYIVDDVAMAVKVLAVIYQRMDQQKQMTRRGL